MKRMETFLFYIYIYILYVFTITFHKFYALFQNKILISFINNIMDLLNCLRQHVFQHLVKLNLNHKFPFHL